MEQYYTPSIEDLRVGYECLFMGKPTIMDGNDLELAVQVAGVDSVSTPYLTKEQIENEKWKCIDKINNSFSKGSYIIIFYPKTHRIQIEHNIDSSWVVQVRFFGYCPSINEFRLITKLIEKV